MTLNPNVPDGRRYTQRFLVIEGLSPPAMPLATCRGADPLLWFPDTQVPMRTPECRRGLTVSEKRCIAASERKAVGLCRDCPEFVPCREWALSNAAHLPIGVIGGTTTEERATYLKTVGERRSRTWDEARAAVTV